MQPPGGSSFFSRQHPLTWLFEALRDEENALHAPTYKVALQMPGDVVAVPEHWSHMVINLASSIATAFEEHT